MMLADAAAKAREVEQVAAARGQRAGYQEGLALAFYQGFVVGQVGVCVKAVGSIDNGLELGIYPPEVKR